MLLRSIALALTLLPSLMSGQQAVPLPPRPSELPPPAANGPSLEATLQYLKEKIEGIGDLRYCSGYIPYTSDGTGAACAQTTQSFRVAVTSASCSIQFDQKFLDSPRSDLLPLGNISRIELTSLNALRGADPSIQNHPDLPEMVIHFLKPSVQVHTTTVVTVPDTSQKVDKKHPQQMIRKVQESNFLTKEFSIVFDDADAADRVAKALTHASELCGGGHKELF